MSPQDGPEYSPRPAKKHAQPRKPGGGGEGGDSNASKAAFASLAVVITAFCAWYAMPHPQVAVADPAPAAAVGSASAEAVLPPLSEMLARPAPPPPKVTVPVENHMIVAAAAPVSSPPPVAPSLAPVPAPVPPTKSLKEALDTAGFVDGSKAIRAQATLMPRAQVRGLFDRSVGGFIPYKDQPERHVVVSVGPPQSAPPRAGGTATPVNTPVPAANQACPDCARAIANSGTTNLRPVGTKVVGTVQFVGRCADGGYIYSVTNHSDKPVAKTMIAPDGEVWKTGGIKPNESVEIRSTAEIHRLTLTP